MPNFAIQYKHYFGEGKVEDFFFFLQPCTFSDGKQALQWGHVTWNHKRWFGLGLRFCDAFF